MTDQPYLPPVHPRSITLLLRFEGLAVLILALVVYWQLGGNWWLFALLILAPDLTAFGYLAGRKLGAAFYNTVHNYALPLLIGLAAYFVAPNLLPFIIIWVAHIGADRLLGYGLKYPDSFGQTHLGPIGKARNARG